MKAGFIGLGDMGAAIARRLAQCGFAVTGCDLSPAALAAFDEPGTLRTSDPMEAARDAQMLGICVRTDDQLESLAGDGRLFAAMAPGGLVLLHSTVSPELARSLAEVARAQGIGFVDVAVSGSREARQSGRLALFVGGEAGDVERARPWLEAIGRPFPLGPVGRGQQGKLLNNLASTANYGMTLAILDLGASLGFDRAQLIEVFQSGSAQSFALSVAPGMIGPRGEDPAAAAAWITDLHDLLRKDVSHGAELATSEPKARAAVLASCEALLARLRRAAAESLGQTPPRDPSATADAYFAAVHARDLDALLGLFAPQAAVRFLDGREVTGGEEIASLYRAAYASGWPNPTPGARYVGKSSVAVEVTARNAAGREFYTCNVFHCTPTGEIDLLTIYTRPSAPG